MYLFKYYTNFALWSVVSRLMVALYIRSDMEEYSFFHTNFRVTCVLRAANGSLFYLQSYPCIQSVANVRWTVRVQLTFHSTSVQNQESKIEVFYKVFLFSHNHVCYFLADTKPANERRLLYFLIRVVERRLQRRFEARDRVAIL